jgi:hypothetical protein
MSLLETRMKKLLATAALLPALAHATGLLDSTVIVHHHYVDGPNTFNTLDKIAIGSDGALSCTSGTGLCQGLTVPAPGLSFTDNAIRFSAADSGSDFMDAKQNRLQFTSLYSGNTAITGVQLTSNIAGMDASRISFGNHTVTVDLNGLQMSPNAAFQLDLQTTAAAVPEPASAALLLGGGLALFAFLRRRRR